ncbi:hypothetical protein EMIHUDRAFT_221822 [Emiliania huxleyi CCMP1516]|uniref:U-box domain-containing protein n=2 Tax=Emiliania huxleyi TaxID=2903 RepID=A0A0D3HXG3_EMIH1|nr:hypothetical protein EMIHUDRAFT_221822 [Emiliania huxleyi CCMP1516]EOD03698.1 hypothetical protein EMIHUDRAFT_221822 [Emiliania huxleyi CCMP1516]|eukprot:XP_005756127.1 hypothetical protein EMIHUDRAFT_221822 [Emiliania huxleyi CCMP1516]
MYSNNIKAELAGAPDFCALPRLRTRLAGSATARRRAGARPPPLRLLPCAPLDGDTALPAAEQAELAAALEESARLEEERRAPNEQVSSLAAERPPSVEEEEPPADFICPITTEVMSDPVMAADGHAYERTAIDRWLATKSTSPMTGEELEFTRLFPSHILRRQIREWREAHPGR